jgi:LPXTG-site transpeptidase (sortase) family protein
MQNVAVLGVDLDGNGTISEIEETTVTASKRWAAKDLPETGFTPGQMTVLPSQPKNLIYQSTGMMIQIPEIGVYTAVTTVPFEDGDWDVTWLGNQVGYLEGSAFPTWSGNTVLTAHITTAYDEPGLFADLDDLAYGDQIVIRAYDQTYTYEVREKLVVRQTDLAAAFKEQRLDWVTLMTCADFSPAKGEYINRLLVRAVLVSVSP